MTNNRLIKVLWVEDDPSYAKGFIGLSDDDLDITLVDNWQAAQQLLDKDFNAFEALILDARCKNTADSVENATRFLVKVFSSLNILMKENNRLLPWYVLSGGDKVEIGDLILEDRIKWDGDRKDPYYHKSQDEKELVERIKAYCKSNTPTHHTLKYMLFKDVFEAIADLNIDKMERRMLYLLEPVADPSKTYDIEGACGKARNIVESMFKDMIAKELLPDSLKKSNNAINMEWCSLVLAGEKDYITRQNGLRKLYDNGSLNCPLFGQLPKIMARSMQTLYKSCCNVAHDASLQQTQNRVYRYDEYQHAVGNTPYLLRSFALQLCDFILWYHNWLKNHPNV